MLHTLSGVIIQRIEKAIATFSEGMEFLIPCDFISEGLVDLPPNWEALVQDYFTQVLKVNCSIVNVDSSLRGQYRAFCIVHPFVAMCDEFEDSLLTDN